MVDTPKFAEIKETQPLKGKLVVITGTSRGIGSKSALAFAEAGADIVGTHANSEERSARRQNSVITQARELNPNVNFESVLVDITDPQSQIDLLNAAVGGDRYNPTRKVDVLVLNAAGGLEEGREEGWANRINNEAQIELVNLFLPHMNEGGKIIFMQSLWAHYYGQIKQYAIYEPVASTKHAAEVRLREMVPLFDEKEVKLNVLVGDVIRDTSVYSMFARAFKADMAELESTVPGGRFPDADDVAAVLRDMVLNPGEQGYTRCIGRETLEPFDRSVIGKEFDRQQIAEQLPMYDDDSLMVDKFTLTGMNQGEATYQVRPKDYKGHFTGPFERIQIMPGHWTDEMAIQAAGLVVLNTRILGTGMPLRKRTESDYLNMAFPKENLRTVANFEGAESGRIICSAEVFGQDGTLVARYNRIAFEVMPNAEIGWRLYRREATTRGFPPNVADADETSASE